MGFIQDERTKRIDRLLADDSSRGLPQRLLRAINPIDGVTCQTILSSFSVIGQLISCKREFKLKELDVLKRVRGLAGY
ncbi:MAG: hypothetical protein LUP95_02690 [Euryarchaeota archaeon]|nr:hypothetical protein [Euryarchaeota archaeon]